MNEIRSFIKRPTSEACRGFRENSGVGIEVAHRTLLENAVSDAIAELKDSGTDPRLIEVLDTMMELISKR